MLPHHEGPEPGHIAWPCRACAQARRSAIAALSRTSFPSLMDMSLRPPRQAPSGHPAPSGHQARGAHGSVIKTGMHQSSRRHPRQLDGGGAGQAASCGEAAAASGAGRRLVEIGDLIWKLAVQILFFPQYMGRLRGRRTGEFSSADWQNIVCHQ